MFKCGTSVALECVQLEKRVEIHELYSCPIIDLLRRHLLEELLLGSGSMLVAVAVGKSKKLSIRSEEREVTAPGVDAYGFDAYAFGCNFAKPRQHFIV